MNISPISFKGTVTIKTQENHQASWKTEVIRTTTKQDAALLKAYMADEVSMGTNKRVKGNVYSRDTQSLHNELERVAGQDIPQVSGFSKFLYLGGLYGNDLRLDSNPYDTTYNKIYYRDNGQLPSSAPKSAIIIDLMEPKERFDAAMQSLSKAQFKIHKMFVASKNDERLNVFTPDKTKLNEAQYAHMEEVLERTNAILDGRERGTYAQVQKFTNTSVAYEALMEALTKAIGIPYEFKHADEIFLGELSERDMDKVSAAVAYLKATRH